jgi:YidC/Oxa1 family membrane protein insertase
LPDQRNLILAIVFSIGILLFFEFFFGVGPLSPPQAPPQEAAQQGEVAPGTPPGTAPALPSGQLALTPGTAPGAPAGMSREEMLSQDPRIQIDSPALQGSISLVGARIDHLVLRNYRETIEADSPDIELLLPARSAKPYFANFNWLPADRAMAVPGPDTVWQADADTLAPRQPVTLSWDNGQGLRFEMAFELDENYMFTVTQRVVNDGTTAATLAPYGLISRTGTPDILGFYILHEGLIGKLSDGVNEIDYDDLVEEPNGTLEYSLTGGWIGITDKYWLVTLIPDQSRAIDARFVHDAPAGIDKYQADFLYQAETIPPGATVEATSRLFAGAKQVLLLSEYRDQLGIELLDRSVDFGWFWFLTIPFFYILHYFSGILGNEGLSILLVTVLVKIVFFPLANKSYRAMAKMRKVQPEMLRLREQFGEDKQRLNQEMMALYKREGANPLSGCLPVVVQIPVFFALYKVLFVSIEMRQAPFFGWIQDLSVRDPTSILNGFGLFPWGVPDLGLLSVLSLGVWPILMGLTMVIQHRLNPQPADPVQAKIFLFMPIVFTFLLASFPAGLVIYWTWNNLLSVIQQYVIMKRAGVAIGRKAGAT